MKKNTIQEELLEMDLELDNIFTTGVDADGFASRAEIIPLVT